MKVFMIIVTILFVFEVASAPAKADGWVLWSKNETAYNNNDLTAFAWSINNAFPDFNKCVEGKKQAWLSKIAQYKKLDNYYAEVDGSVEDFISTRLKNPKDVYGTFTTFYCLPGTLDPRDRK